MIETGQAVVRELGYWNPQWPGYGLEVLTLSSARRRVPDTRLFGTYRPAFHQILLVTRGEGIASVDFNELPCQRGTLLHISPGQVRRLPRPEPGEPIDAPIVLFTEAFPAVPGRFACPDPAPYGAGVATRPRSVRRCPPHNDRSQAHVSGSRYTSPGS